MKELIVKTSRKVELVDITSEINALIRDAMLDEGIAFIFVPHTTAALTVNENADPSVREDIAWFSNRLVPSLPDFKHLEGNSDSHIKSSLFGVSLILPVKHSSLYLGRWQGVYLAEFDGPRVRKVWLNLYRIKSII